MPIPQLIDAQGNPLRAAPTRRRASADTAHFGASRSAREFASWNASGGSADADLLTELGTLRSRSRDLVRNHGLASSAMQTMADNVVGTGLRLRPKPDYRLLGWTKEQADEWADLVESHWSSFAEWDTFDAARQLDFYGMTALIFRSAISNGDALALPLWRPDRRGSRWATCVQLVESDRLENPNGRFDSAKMRGGIEIDTYGEPLAYYIRKSHPGDIYGMGTAAEWVRVPARLTWGRRRVIHIHDKERTGQTRGKPLLSAVMAPFKMHDHYQRSELQAAVVNAMVAAFVETPLGEDAMTEMIGDDMEGYLDKRDDFQVRLQGGSIIPLFPGDKLSTFAPARPNSAFGPFVENILRHIAAGMNMPYELLVKDFSKTNYSSARAALLEAWRYFIGRRTWLSKYWAQPIYELWLEEAVNSGRIPAPGFYRNLHAYTRAKWIGPGRGWVDPVKEAQAAKIRMENGLSTLEDEAAEQGKDWRDVLEQRASEFAMMDGLNLPRPEGTQSVVVTNSDERQQDEGKQ